jgi:hypothetical protein
MGRMVRRMTAPERRYETPESAEGPDMYAAPLDEEGEGGDDATLDAVLVVYQLARRRRERSLYGKSGYRSPTAESIRANTGGGEDPTRKHFRQLADALDAERVDPWLYIPRRFAMTPNYVVQPSQLLSGRDARGGLLTGVDLVRSLMTSKTYREDMRLSLKSQQASFKTALALVDDVRYALLDSLLELSPLFRWLAARACGEEQIAAIYYEAARAQYMPYADDYDVAWGETVLPNDAIKELWNADE